MEMAERLAKVETHISNIKEDVKDIKSLLNEQKQWQIQTAKEMDRKYANKWVEKVLISMLVLALATLFNYFK